MRTSNLLHVNKLIALEIAESSFSCSNKSVRINETLGGDESKLTGLRRKYRWNGLT